MSASRPPARRLARRLAAALASIALLACGDGTSPEERDRGFTGALTAQFQPDTVSPLDPAYLLIQLPTRSDNAPIDVIVTLGGTAMGTDTVTVAGLTASLRGTFTVPAGAPDGPVTAAITIRGTTFRAAAYLVVHDRRPPVVNGSMSQVTAPPMPAVIPPDFHLAAGGRVQLSLDATDNVALRWVGYEFGPPFGGRDSVAVTGASTWSTFTVSIPIALAGTTPTYSIFARDVNDNRATKTLGTVRIYPYLDRTNGIAALDATVRDVAYDGARDRLYLSQPDAGRIAVLSVAGMTWLPPIPTPFRPAGLDLSVSGDSLLVALERTAYLGVIDLRAATPAVDTLRLRYDPAPFTTPTPTNMVPWASGIRIAADGRAVVTLGTPTNVTTPRLITVDLASGQQSALQGGGDNVVPITRTEDRSSVLVTNIGVGVRYRASTHRVEYFELSGAPPGAASSPHARSDRGGSFFLFGQDLYDADMRWVRRMGVEGYASSRTALSPDAADVYAASPLACADTQPPCAPGTAPGLYQRLGRIDGELREIVRTPEWAQTLLPLPDGRRMLAIGPSMVVLVDLTAAGARSALPPPFATAAMRPMPARAMSLDPVAWIPRVRWTAPGARP